MTLLVFPALYPTSQLLSYPARAGIPNYEEGANTLSWTRPETSASPTRVSTTVTGTLHTRFSGLGKPPYRTLLLSGWGLPDRPTSLLTIHHRSLARLHTRSLSQSYTSESHNDSINSDNTRHYINPPNILVHLNTITKRLHLIFKTRLLSSRIHARLTNSPCHRKRPPPVRRQSPTTTTRGR